MREIDDIQRELEGKIAKYSAVVDELDKSEAIKVIMEDFLRTKKSIDDAWHLVSDLSKLNELRITKLATVSILGLRDAYAADLERTKKELKELTSPEEFIIKDFDNN